MIEIRIHPTGDSAEADTPAEARVAARQLMREARDQGCRPTATFIVDGVLVREGVKRGQL
jgi:hypothetical protein